jgi:hypothetical protein
LLLPDDWRSWDTGERLAVLAHEVAHIQRRDYLAGLAAQLALALHFYHPLVRWTAGRLLLQQELAADAIGARFAGGRGAYLLALSRLALKQDGRFPRWPARSFLPARRTLIRRIAMLRDDSVSAERPWPRVLRISTGLCLLAVAAGVATLRGPALGDEPTKPGASAFDLHGYLDALNHAPPAVSKPGLAPFDARYLPDNTAAVIAFRPAATFRRTGTPDLSTLIHDVIGFDLSDLPKQFKVDPTRPGFLKIGLEDIEWVGGGINFGHSKTTNAERDDLHSIMFSILSVRTVAPFDWKTFLRQWRVELVEAHEGSHTFYKMTGPLASVLGPKPCVYLPDDKTAVFNEEDALRKFVRRKPGDLPAYLSGPDWDRVKNGLLAVVANNHDGRFAKAYDLGRRDDALVMSLFKGVDHWVFGLDDADSISMHASASCAGETRDAVVGAVKALVKMGEDELKKPATDVTDEKNHAAMLRMARLFLSNFRVGTGLRSIGVSTRDFGTLAEFGALVEADFKNEAEIRKKRAETKRETGPATRRGAAN